ncbi:hypothetical protein [Burkholderia gladioli]|uniref:hypothetical protein n=1 Tax=Burkholderia gladioli TaxID=28095 RepID=UPI0020B3470E|nr:hypothetical protein [Burkholderia gladioli]
MKMKKRFVLTSIMSAAVLLSACGGGDDDGGTLVAGGNTAGSTSQGSKETTKEAAFSCPSSYKKLTLSNSSISNANMNLVTDDGIATLTIKTPANGISGDFAVCLGKPDPVLAGVAADYVYEVKSAGDLHSMASSTLTLNFKTDVKPTQNPPVIEYASLSGGTVSYQPLQQGASISNAPNYSVAANAQASGLYVVRLTK